MTWIIVMAAGTLRHMIEQSETPPGRPAPSSTIRPADRTGVAGPRDIERAYVPTATSDPIEGGRISIAWLDRASGPHAGQPLIVTPSRRHLGRDPHLAAAANRYPSVTASTLRGIRGRGWRGGPVLLHRPDARTVGWAERSLSVRALCVVQGVDYDPSSWARAFRADDLTTGRPCYPSEDIDPLVEAVLSGFRASVDWHGLSTRVDAAKAMAALRILRDRGHRLDPATLETWALEVGWRPTVAQKLSGIARSLEDDGREPHDALDSRSRDLVDLWAVGLRRSLAALFASVTSEPITADRARTRNTIRIEAAA